VVVAVPVALMLGVAVVVAVPVALMLGVVVVVAKTALSAKNGALVDSESIGDFSQNRSFKKLNDELDRAWEAWGTRAGIDFAS
jgi:Tfp pilus assembly protein PilN